MNNCQNNNQCNCNKQNAPVENCGANIDMHVCEKNIQMLPMLQTYNTIVLKPNICCKKNILTQQMLSCEDTKYVIRWDFDLNGQTITVPERCILEFDGGSLKNGTIVGNITQIIATDIAIFENITISGTWNCPEITSAWFSDATNDNMLKQIFNLTNEDIDNTVRIVKGIYSVSAQSEGEHIIHITSNTHVENMGTITLAANDLDTCYIFSIGKGNTNKVSNISFKGGTIIGDKNTHTGSSGEHGMGMAITNAEDVYVSDVEIKDCWGDSIYIGHSTWGKAINVVVENFKLSGSRRQGISIINSKNIVIRNGEIANIKGTLPEAGIDIEPNINTDINKNIIIENVTFNTEKALLITHGGNVGESENLNREITVRNCVFNCGGVGCPIQTSFCTNVNFSDNELNDVSESRENTDAPNSIFVMGSSDFGFFNNTVKTNRKSIVRNDFYMKMVGNTLINTSETGELFRQEVKMPYSIVESNYIKCSGNVIFPSNTIIEKNTIIAGDENITSNMSAANCRLSDNTITVSGNVTVSDNSNINGCTISCNDFSISSSRITGSYFVSKYIYVGANSVIINSLMSSIREKLYESFVAVTDNVIIHSCIIKHGIEGATEQVMFIGNNNKISDTEIIFTKENDTQISNCAAVISSTVTNDNNIIKDVTVEGDCPIYVKDRILNRATNKIVSPLKNFGTTSERASLNVFYMILGFMFYDTTLGKPVYASAIEGESVVWKYANGEEVEVDDN